MLDKVLDTLDPYIAEFIFATLTFYFGGVIRLFFRTQESQANLKKAIGTGVDLVTDELARLASGGNYRAMSTIPPATVERMVNYVESSVPDSIKHLKATRSHLRMMVEAAAKKHVLQLKQLF